MNSFLRSNKNLPNQFSSSFSSSSAYSSGFESQCDSIDFIFECEVLNNEQQDCKMESDSFPSSFTNPNWCDANKFDYVFDYAPATEQNNQNGSQQAVELWQFLLELLEDRRGLSIIHWVSNSSSAAASGDQPASTQQTKETATTSTASLHDNEFVILDPIEVSKRWALRRNKPFTTYKKFNRILRSYYNKKKILHKTAGKANAFAFQINVQPYLNQIRSWQQQQMQDFSKMRHY